MLHQEIPDKQILQLNQRHHLRKKIESDEPFALEDYMSFIDITVKKDYAVKRLVFLTALSAYTPNPLNMFLRGPSSIGKTYNVMETLKIFEPKDVWKLGGLSPTALVHEHGVLVDPEEVYGEDGNYKEVDLDDKPTKKNFLVKTKEGKKVLDKEAWRDAGRDWQRKMKRCYYLVDLTHKILVFLDSPYVATFNRLRPILSHDAEEISYKFTDKNNKGSLRTSHVVIKGWPSCIFCTTNRQYLEDLATRSFTITPDMTMEKYREAIQLQGLKKAYPEIFNLDTIGSMLHAVLYGNMDKVNLKKYSCEIPYGVELSNVFSKGKRIRARFMRDFKHFTSLIEVHALLCNDSRPHIERDDGKHIVLATMEDFEVAKNIWKSCEETTLTGVESSVITFYHIVLQPFCRKEIVATYKGLAEKYHEVMPDKIVTTKTISKWCNSLEDIGYIDIRTPTTAECESGGIDRRNKIVELPSGGFNLDINLPSSSLEQFQLFFRLENFKKWISNKIHYSPQNTFIIRQKDAEYDGEPLQVILDEERFIKRVFEGECITGVKYPHFEETTEEKVVNSSREELGIITRKINPINSLSQLFNIESGV